MLFGRTAIRPPGVGSSMPQLSPPLFLAGMDLEAKRQAGRESIIDGSGMGEIDDLHHYHILEVRFQTPHGRPLRIVAGALHHRLGPDLLQLHAA